MDEVKPVARVPTVEHREPCELRGSRTVLGAPGGEIPPGDSTNASDRHPSGGRSMSASPCRLNRSTQHRRQISRLGFRMPGSYVAVHLADEPLY